MCPWFDPWRYHLNPDFVGIFCFYKLPKYHKKTDNLKLSVFLFYSNLTIRVKFRFLIYHILLEELSRYLITSYNYLVYQTTRL